MRKFLTEKRLQKLTKTATQRQHSLELIIENVHDPHNVSAIFRSCDAVGVPKVSLVYYIEKFPKISKVSSASAFKWVERERFDSIEECYSDYKKKGFKIYASQLNENAVSLYDLDLTEKCVIVVGNEHRGISDKAADLADKVFYIPMRGMVQSLNVSVATAVSLYEAQRQRSVKGMYEKSELKDEELDQLIDEWANK